MLKRVLRSFRLSLLILIVTIVGQVLTVPVLLNAWGDQMYGEWVAMTSFIDSMSLLNFGLQSYVLNLLIGAFVKNDFAYGTTVIRAALRLYMVVCGIALVAILILAFGLDVRSWLNISMLSASETKVILLLQGGIALYLLFSGLLMSILIATGKQPLRLVYALTQRMMLTGVPILVAALGGLPYTISILLVLAIGTHAFIEVREVYRISPFKLGVSSVSWAQSFALVPPSLQFFLVSLSTVLMSSGLNVMIASGISPQATVLYSVSLMLFNFVRLVLGNLTNVLWPEVTMIASTGDRVRLAQWHRNLQRWLGLVVLLMCAGLVVLGPDVLRIWTNNEVTVDPILILLLAVHLIVQSPSLITRTFALALSRQGELVRLELINAGIALGISLVAMPVWGVRSVGIGLIAGQVFYSSVLEIISRGWFEEKTRTLPPWLPITVITIFFVGVVFYAGQISFQQFSERIVLIVPVMTIVALVGWFFLLSQQDKQYFNQILSKYRVVQHDANQH